MLWDDKNPNTVLDKCFASMNDSQASPQFWIDASSGYSLESDAEAKHHEAAYDAMMTGVVFGKSLKKLEIFDNVLKNKKFDSPILESLHKSITGKLPLGGLRTPFCLGDQIRYDDQASAVYHCKLAAGNIEYAKLAETVEKMVDRPVSVYLVYSDVAECYFTFKSPQDAASFGAELSTMGGAMMSKQQSPSEV